MGALKFKDENGNWLLAEDAGARAYTDEKIQEVYEGLEKQYEKVATVVVAPDTDGALPTTIKITVDDNGNPFELTDFYLDAQKIAITSGNINVFFNGQYVVGNASIWDINNSSGNLKKWACFYRSLGDNMGGVVNYPSNTIPTSGVYPNSNESGNRTIFIPPNVNKSSSYKFGSVKTISLQCVTTTATFVEGTTLVLWGVRK